MKGLLMVKKSRCVSENVKRPFESLHGGEGVSGKFCGLCVGPSVRLCSTEDSQLLEQSVDKEPSLFQSWLNRTNSLSAQMVY